MDGASSHHPRTESSSTDHRSRRCRIIICMDLCTRTSCWFLRWKSLNLFVKSRRFFQLGVENVLLLSSGGIRKTQGISFKGIKGDFRDFFPNFSFISGRKFSLSRKLSSTISASAIVAHIQLFCVPFTSCHNTR